MVKEEFGTLQGRDVGCAALCGYWYLGCGYYDGYELSGTGEKLLPECCLSGMVCGEFTGRFLVVLPHENIAGGRGFGTGRNGCLLRHVLVKLRVCLGLIERQNMSRMYG